MYWRQSECEKNKTQKSGSTNNLWDYYFETFQISGSVLYLSLAHLEELKKEIKKNYLQNISAYIRDKNWASLVKLLWP